MALNCVTLMGRMVKDAEIKTTPTGTNVTNFVVAVDKAYNKNNDHPEANFIDCVAWNKTAEFVSKYFQKGSRIVLEGYLQTRTYEDKENKKHKVTEVVASNVHFVDKKSDNSVSQQQDSPSDDDGVEPFSLDTPF